MFSILRNVRVELLDLKVLANSGVMRVLLADGNNILDSSGAGWEISKLDDSCISNFEIRNFELDGYSHCKAPTVQSDISDFEFETHRIRPISKCLRAIDESSILI